MRYVTDRTGPAMCMNMAWAGFYRVQRNTTTMMTVGNKKTVAQTTTFPAYFCAWLSVYIIASLV